MGLVCDRFGVEWRFELPHLCPCSQVGECVPLRGLRYIMVECGLLRGFFSSSELGCGERHCSPDPPHCRVSMALAGSAVLVNVGTLEPLPGLALRLQVHARVAVPQLSLYRTADGRKLAQWQTGPGDPPPPPGYEYPVES